jgi:hypothetical protein
MAEEVEAVATLQPMQAEAAVLERHWLALAVQQGQQPLAWAATLPLKAQPQGLH